MIKARTFLFIGIWVAILPYLGFPFFWKNVLFTLTGLAIAYFGYILYKECKNNGEIKINSFDNFSENKDFNEKPVKTSTESYPETNEEIKIRI